MAAPAGGNPAGAVALPGSGFRRGRYARNAAVVATNRSASSSQG